MLHVFCRLCIEQVVDTVTAADDKLADMEDIVVDVSSSKINAALKEMLRIRRGQPGDKIIVVSQFTSFSSPSSNHSSLRTSSPR